ncbi:MAG: hypothetical protein QOD86_91 [Miltoncostaeaceae bacterium]|jgi:subtilisin family serine protease|nr:hypothetical protein [Miltoncostaeaceae bacterium]
MRSLRPFLGVAVVAAAAALAPAAAAAVPAKAPDPASPATSDSAPYGTFGRTLPGRARLMVTFLDSPRAAVARRRLAPLGEAEPLLPEAGIWIVDPDRFGEARERALALPRVAGVEWSLARGGQARARPEPPDPLPGAPVIDDPLYDPGVQWGLFRGPTWRPELAGITSRPRIAILDTGIDANHEEWASDPGALVAPRSTVRDSADVSDWSTTGHGTHVAGIAAAPANGIGIVGVAPARSGTAEVIPVQITDPVGNSDDESMIRGIRWAVRNGARVINISSGGEGYTRAFRDTVYWATGRGALIVAAVGNEGDSINTLNYPAAFPKVVGVGAQCDGEVSVDCPEPYGPALFSNHNRSVDVIAPGVDIVSTVPIAVEDRDQTPGYASKTGTSMAAPYVTGVAALIQAANGNRLSPYQVLRQLVNTAIDTGKRGLDRQSGYGIVNPRAAVTLRAPADDPDEVNDDIKFIGEGQRAKEQEPIQRIEARVDVADDREDVYPVVLQKGQRLDVTLTHPRGDLRLYLWRAGTATVSTAGGNGDRNVLRYDEGEGRKSVRMRAPRSGRYFVNVYALRGSSDYTLTVERS